MDKPMDVAAEFPVRKTGKQKRAFREAVRMYVSSLGYPVRVEKGRFGSRNIVIGDPEWAEYLVTAHYDTCARLPFPNFITPCNLAVFLGFQTLIALGLIALALLAFLAVALTFHSPAAGEIACYAMVALMLVGPANSSNANDNTSGVVTVLEIARTLPKEHRGKVCFVLFDLEEAGLIGSSSYRAAHRMQTDRQIVLNLDCVGDGDQMRMFPTARLRKDRKRLTRLYAACGYYGRKSLVVHEKGIGIYPSDQKSFPYGVGICALRRGKLGLYISRIHTPKDTVLDQTNINFLRAALVTLLCRPTEQ